MMGLPRGWSCCHRWLQLVRRVRLCRLITLRVRFDWTTVVTRTIRDSQPSVRGKSDPCILWLSVGYDNAREWCHF